MGLTPKGQQGGQSSAAAPNNSTSTKAASTYWPVGSDGDISYVYSVRRAWEGGAYVLALIVVVCSGVWPYTKNILLCLAWFAPLTPRARGQLLAWTNRFGRWGLVDVMAVIVIVVGTNFRLVLGTVHVVAEARNAICTFAVRWVQVHVHCSCECVTLRFVRMRRNLTRTAVVFLVVRACCRKEEGDRMNESAAVLG